MLTARYLRRKLIWDWKNLIEVIQDGKLRTEPAYWKDDKNLNKRYIGKNLEENNLAPETWA